MTCSSDHTDNPGPSVPSSQSWECCFLLRSFTAWETALMWPYCINKRCSQDMVHSHVLRVGWDAGNIRQSRRAWLSSTVLSGSCQALTQLDSSSSIVSTELISVQGQSTWCQASWTQSCRGWRQLITASYLLACSRHRPEAAANLIAASLSNRLSTIR